MKLRTRLWMLFFVLPSTIALVADVSRSAEPARSDDNLAVLVQLLQQIDDADVQRDLLQGMHTALRGRRQIAAPAGWEQVAPKLLKSPDAEIRSTAGALSVLFGDPAVLAALRRQAADPKAAVDERARALELLVHRRDPAAESLLKQMFAEPAVRPYAIRGLAAIELPAAPQWILERYAEFTPAEQQDAIATLASRGPYIEALLTGLEAGTIPRQDVSAFIARQLLQRNDADLTARLTKVWGTVRPAAEDKGPQLAKYKSLLTPENLAQADPRRGRLIFQKNCTSCHLLFGTGTKLGPDLTGAQRTSVDYVLENLLDPSALVGRDYRMTIIETAAGRIVNGIVVQENPQVVTVQTANELLYIPQEEIEDRVASPVSMMPEGLLQKLHDQEVLDLVKYLGSPQQVPLPDEPAAE